jgi:hypothetical protein
MWSEKGDENSFLCSHLQLEDIEKMVEQKKIFKHFKPVTLFDWFWNILNVSLYTYISKFFFKSM